MNSFDKHLTMKEKNYFFIKLKTAQHGKTSLTYMCKNTKKRRIKKKLYSFLLTTKPIGVESVPKLGHN